MTRKAVPKTWDHPIRTDTPVMAIEEAIRRLSKTRRPVGPKGSTSYAHGSRDARQQAFDLLWDLWREVREREKARCEQ